MSLAAPPAPRRPMECNRSSATPCRMLRSEALRMFRRTRGTFSNSPHHLLTGTLSVTQNLGPQCSLRRFSHLRLCVPLLAALIAMGCARSRPAAVGIPGAPMPNAGASSPAPPIASTPAQPESSPVPVESEPAPVAPSTFVQQGVASWYGKPFNGRHASDGEIYHMNDAVAAHRTLPFGSMVRVTNLNNGLHTDVRIIDRGPFVHGRIIDLSRAAARAIQMIGPGTAPVRIELLSSP